MRLEFNHMVPLPMVHENLEGSEVWRKHVEIITGEKVLIQAPSGTGKTSLHAFMGGFRHDYQGEFRVENQPARDFTLNRWSNLRLYTFSFIFQDLRLLPGLTVMENLQVKNQVGKKYSDDKLKIMLQRVGIDGKWDVPCALLSMGQQQRVAIVRALLQPFAWLIADEPFSHLDDNNIQGALKLMQERIAEEKSGFILMSLGPEYGVSFNHKLSL